MSAEKMLLLVAVYFAVSTLLLVGWEYLGDADWIGLTILLAWPLVAALFIPLCIVALVSWPIQWTYDRIRKDKA